MLFDTEKKKAFLNGKLFYVVLTVCLTAVGLGTWAAVSSNVQFNRISSDEDITNEIEIDWDNAGGRTLTIVYDEPDTEANMTVQNVPDERDGEASTSEAASDNQPYVGEYILPLGSNIIKDYSGGEMVRSKTTNDWRVHNGIDFGDSRGASVMAMQDGVVTQVYTDDLWGTVVVIEHGGGLTAKYCGLSGDRLPEVGHQVEKHEIIGTLGEIPIESADGPHLHLEITVDEIVVDPLKAMNKLGVIN